MPKTIDDATFEQTIRRPWFYPGAHESPGVVVTSDDPVSVVGCKVISTDFPADDYEAALASSEPIPTEPGDLEDTRRSAEGLGFVMAGCTLAGVAAGAALAHLWPAIVAWGMR